MTRSGFMIYGAYGYTGELIARQAVARGHRPLLAGRRRGVGRAAIGWLWQHVWGGRRVRVDVLVGNAVGVAFWRAVGFRDYCLTLELEGG